MHSALNPKTTELHDSHSDQPDLLVIAPDVVLVAPGDKELSSLAHDAIARPWDPQPRTAVDPPVDKTFRAASFNDIRIPRDQPSIGRRAVRGLVGLLLAVCIGGAAMAWHAYGDATSGIIEKWAPPFARSSSPPLERPALADQQVSTAKPTPPQPAPAAQTLEVAAPTAPARPAESPQSLPSMAREIEQLKSSIAQLRASQEQMSRDIAKASEAKTSEAKTSEARAAEAKTSEPVATHGSGAQGAAAEPNSRPRISLHPPRSVAAPARKPVPPSQAAATPALPQGPAPEPQQQIRIQQQDELVPRPPMPVR